MIQDLHLAAVVSNGLERSLYQLPLAQGVQASLEKDWTDQLSTLVAGKEVVAFDPAYNPEESELLSVAGFESPAWLKGKTTQNANTLPKLTITDEIVSRVRGLIAFVRDSGQEVVLFQQFSKSKVLRPGGVLVLQSSGTYTAIKDAGIILGDRLVAELRGGTLRFESFRAINAIMPLPELYRAATEQEIRTTLSHQNVVAENVDALAKDPTQWLAKRFALLQSSGVLDKYKPKVIQGKAKKYGLTIKLEKGKIVFPADRSDAKRLLQYLNEELFRGAISDALYSTNSKKAES
jgi:hypothetical protein